MSYKTEPLSQVATVIDSLHKTPKYDDNGTHYMARATDVKYGYLNLSNMLKVNTDVYNDFTKRYKPSNGDIIITRVGSYGNTSFVKNTNFCLGQNTAAIVPNINNKYLFYMLNSRNIRHQIESYVVGTTQKTLSLKAINSILIPRFNEETEQKIAHILSTLDDKIELNRKMNQTLEEMAQALFKSWFVDFDPVYAKADCKSDAELEKVAAELGVSKEILELFPSELVESEMGMIPKGWEAKSLGDICSIITKGTTPKKSDIQNATDEATIPFIKVKDIASTGEINRDSLELIPNSVHSGTIKRSILKEDDLLFSIAGTIGRVAVVDGDLDNANTNQAVGIIRLKDKSQHLSLIWLALQSDVIQKNITSKVVQGVQANTSLTNLRDIPVLLPTTTLLNRWNDVVGGIIDTFRINQVESRTLVLARDTLLPKLLSGEMDVSEVEI